jgi:hypothetical protein
MGSEPFSLIVCGGGGGANFNDSQKSKVFFGYSSPCFTQNLSFRYKYIVIISLLLPVVCTWSRGRRDWDHKDYAGLVAAESAALAAARSLVAALLFAAAVGEEALQASPGRYWRSRQSSRGPSRGSPGRRRRRTSRSCGGPGRRRGSAASAPDRLLAPRTPPGDESLSANSSSL